MPSLYTIRHLLYAVLALSVLEGGCENLDEMKSKIAELTDSKKDLRRQLEQTKSENEQLKQQVQVLSGIKPDVRLEHLYNLKQIKITRYTGLYDKDEDGRKEKLIVYIQPIDQDGDIVKATGVADVELWDLNRKDGRALLGKWQVGAEELRGCWFATVLIINYRLTFDVPADVGGFAGPLVVKVTFTDYLSGKVFREQKIIEGN